MTIAQSCKTFTSAPMDRVTPLLWLLGVTSFVWLPFAILPWGWMWRLGVVLATATIAITTLEQTYADSGLGYAIMQAIVMFAGLMTGTIVTLRIVVRVVQNRKHGLPLAFHLTFIDTILAIPVAATLAGLIFYRLRWLTEGSDQPLLVHLFVISAALALAVTAWVKRDIPVLRAGCTTVAITLAALTVLSWTYPATVVAQATALAGESPFCLSLQSRRRSPQSLRDLTFLTMDKSRVPFHAVLVVQRAGETKFAHWSYRKARFDLETSRTNFWSPVSYCHPTTTKLLQNPDGFSHAITNSRWLAVPETFSPRFYGGVSLAVAVPGFSSIPRVPHTVYPSVEYNNGNWIDGLLKSPVVTTSQVYGLNLQSETNGKTVYYEASPDGTVLTHIACYTSRPTATACQHRFRRDGHLYSLEHEEALVPEWQILQDRFYALITSFDVTPN